MQPVSMKTRVLLFLYSTRNLAGCALALGGLGLFFGGMISDWWFPIVAGLYAVGWFAVPADQGLALKIRSEVTQANLTEGMDELLDESVSKLPHEAVERLRRIQQIVEELAPKIFSGGVTMDYAIALTNAVMRDLPETVKNYLRLPTAFATLHVIDNGKTCKQLLLDQLDLLSEQLSKIADNVYKDDAEALVVNGKFLKEKFHAVSFIE